MKHLALQLASAQLIRAFAIFLSIETQGLSSLETKL
jgi:hypothetical protein